MWNETIALSIVNALTAVIEMLLAIVLMDSFFVFRFQKKAIKYITGFAAAGLLFAISLLPFGWSTPLEILLIALMLISMYKGNIRYKAIYCVVCALAVSLASILASMILSILPENLPLIDNSSMFFSMLRLILPKALLMIFIFCLSSLLKRKSWNFAPKYWILLLSVPLITLAIFTVFQYYIDALPPQARQISESIRILINGEEIIFPWLSIYGYIITAGIGLIFINILVFVLFSRLQKNADMKTRYEILTRQIEEQSASIEKLENSYRLCCREGNQTQTVLEGIIYSYQQENGMLYFLCSEGDEISLSQLVTMDISSDLAGFDVENIQIRKRRFFYGRLQKNVGRTRYGC